MINNITYLFRGFDDITNIVSTPSYYLNPKNGPINDTSSVTGVYLPYQYDWEDNQIININRRRALVHIDSRERIGCSTRSQRELHPVGAEKRSEEHTSELQSQ